MNSKYEPRQNEVEGKIYWMPYNTVKKKYSTLTAFDKYKTKRACAAAIKFYERCFG